MIIPSMEKLKSSKIMYGLSKALWDSDLIATRVSLAIGEFLWSIMLLWPGHTFDRPTYKVMALVMGEEAWGFILLLSAATQITIVMGEHLHSLPSRVFAAWNAVLWIFLVMSMLLSVYPPPAAIGGEISLAFAAIWVWLRPYILQDMYNKVCNKCGYDF